MKFVWGRLPNNSFKRTIQVYVRFESYQQLSTLSMLVIRMLYMLRRVRWCDIIVLNVHEPTEDKTDHAKPSFYEELEYVFNKFLQYHMKILLGDFNAKVGMEDNFKLTIRNKSLQ
jgi:hypothetical protein